MNHLSKKLFTFLLLAIPSTFLLAQSPCFSESSPGKYDFVVPVGINTLEITAVGADGGGHECLFWWHRWSG